MNLNALIQNLAHAKVFCRNAFDRIKFLWWLYSKSLPLSIGRSMTLHFTLTPPVNDAVLTVRCNGGSDAFVFSEVFEHRYYDFDLPTLPRTILDAGANAGFTALFFARKYPEAELACIEPMPGNVQLLHSNLAQNGVIAKVFPKAICVEDGPVVMQIAANDYGHKVAGIEYGRTLEGGAIEVGAISVPTLMAELGWERIGLFKVDIEGYEGVLLREKCQWLERVDAMCIECHEGFGEEDLRAVAAKFGFSDLIQVKGTWVLSRKPSSIR